MMNNNIVLLGILVILINFSFYLKMGSVNKSLLFSGIAVVSAAVLVLLFNNRNREKFQDSTTKEPLTDETIKNAISNYFSIQALKKKSAISKHGEMKDWDVSQVTDMSSLFQDSRRDGRFNEDISGWDTGNVTDMSNMFFGQPNFNRDLTNWDTSKVTDMSGMFFFAKSFNGNISGWNTGNVTNMSSMFEEASVFNQDIGSWNTGNVTTMRTMFKKAKKFNQDISGWNTGKVIDMFQMFMGGFGPMQDTDFNQDISGWNVDNLRIMTEMFVNSAWGAANGLNDNVQIWKAVYKNNNYNENNYAAFRIPDSELQDVGNEKNSNNELKYKTCYILFYK